MRILVRSKGMYVRVDEEFLEEFTRVARSLGMTRSEAVRKAMELFLELYRGSRKDPYLTDEGGG